MPVAGLDDTIKWYDEHAEQYATASATNFDINHITTFTDLLPKGGNVLDVGCGAGRDAGPLQQRGFNVTGIDLSKGLIAVARKKFPGVTFVEGDMLHLPFEKNSFDGVWSNASLLHFEKESDVRQALSEMSRVLRPAGVLHILVKEQANAKTAIVADKLTGHERFFQYFTVDELTSLLDKTDFSIMHITAYGETETKPHGREELRLIWCLARKK